MTAEDLLAHTDWLHALARALAGDANAEDVVQQTYEAALTKPPKEAGPLRPWLGGVARNMARMATRGRVRREQREQVIASAPVVEVPTPEQLVERVQMQQRVARVVLELPEPLRATLLLRFFEGMTAAEIARAQNIPAATVRGRIKDALDRVRATLDTEHGGDRKRWIVLLVPLAIPDTASGIVAGGIIVKTGTKLVIGVVVLLAVLLGTRWLGWWGGKTEPPATATGSGSGSAVQTPTAPVVIAKPGATRSSGMYEVVHDDDPKGNLRVEGQVIDEQDKPVGGAKVAIDAHPPLVVETEADGSFVFEGLIPRDYRLEATGGDGYAGPARLRLTAKAEPVTLRMKRAGSVEVTVVTADGAKPIAGADVELRSSLTWQGKTDAKGVVQLRGVGAVWAPLAVRAPGFSPTGMILSTAGDPAQPAKVRIAMTGGAAIAGRVLDDAGKPVEGARVVAIDASQPFPIVDARRDGVLSGKDGAFVLPTLSAGTWRMTATLGEHAPATSAPITVDGVSARKGVELVLESGGVVRGIVKDKGGAPVAAADVRVVARGYLEWRARRQTYTAADGTFTIVGLPRRAMDVVAAHDTGGSAIMPLDLVGTREHQVTIALDVVGAIAGMVVDRTGAPVGDAQVIAEPEYTGGVEERAAWHVRGVQEAVTDQAGLFRFAGLPDGNYRVRAARPGASEAALSLASATVTRPGTTNLKLVIPNDGKIVGKVALAGKVPVHFAITVGEQATPFSTADGTFSLTVPAGTHALAVTGSGFVEKKLSEVVVTEGKNTDLGTIELVAGRSVSGRVLDDAGAPVAKAQVAAGRILTGGGKELYIADESPGAKDTLTDDNGRFTIDGFPPGPITIQAGKDGTGRSETIRIRPSTDSVTIDLVLRATSGLEGKITRSGAPAAETVVIAKPVGAFDGNFFTTTGADGTFALDALAPGGYIVSAQFGGGGPRPKDLYVTLIDVVAGKRAKVEIDATPGVLALSVKVNAAAMVMAIGAEIDPKSLADLIDATSLPRDGKIITTHIRPAMTGQIDIEGMRPGVHTVCVTAMAPDAKPACKHITLDPGTPKRSIEMTLPK